MRPWIGSREIRSAARRIPPCQDPRNTAARVALCSVIVPRLSTPESQTAVWVVRAGKGGRHAAEFQSRGIIAIGFSEAGDPTELSRDQLFAQTRDAAGSRSGNIAGQVDRFARVMRVGDLVAVPDGGTRELLCGRITGEYDYRSEPPVEHFRNVRNVTWIARRHRDDLPDRILFTLGSLRRSP